MSTGVATGVACWRSSTTAGDHARDFGLVTTSEYMAAAAAFLQQAQTGGLPAVVGGFGIVRADDPVTNTLASYDSRDGTIRTFFRPTSTTSWGHNRASWGRPVEWGR